MYEQTFQFSSRPFNSVPRLEDFFAGVSYQQALDVAHMCVDRSTGPVVVVGSVGMGKSLVLQKIAQSFESRFDIVHIECSRLEERSELLQSILFELNLPYSGLTEGELRLSLMGYLKQNQGADDGVLLLVDEADRLSVELIDELRLITNQIRDGRSLVQLVLAGTQRLEESLSDPKLASFNQRIAARCVLQNFSKEETERFIYQHIEQAGRSGEEFFNEEAVDEIQRNTDGCPRLINQLCDQSLLLAASRDQQPVDRQLIQEAWAEMQNMPVPSASGDAGWENAPESGGNRAVVEFGQLGDYETASRFDDSPANDVGNDPFAADVEEAPCGVEEAACDSEEAPCESEEPACCGEEPTCDVESPADNEQDEFEHSDESAAEGDDDVVDANPADSAPGAVHATAAALAASAFAATAYNSDPFDPQGEAQLEDGNTESERIASLEQEQEELIEQTRGYDESGSEEARSVFEDLDNSEENVEPSPVDDMVPADPFQGPDDAVNHVDSDEASDTTEQVVGVQGCDSQPEETSSPMAQCSIEEQLGLVEHPAEEPSSFHTPPFEPREFVESESFQKQNSDPFPAENTDSYAPTAEAPDPFAESFEEEEMLQDAYSPFVAEQNQASLSVTSSQLSHLTPLDEAQDASGDADPDQWNTQTPELAIEELDAMGVSTDATPGDIEAINEGDFVTLDGVQAADDFSPTHALASPGEAWQDNKDTAWDPSQYQVPAEVESETPASFQPVPSVQTEIGPITITLPEDAPVNSAFNQDPFSPQEEATLYGGVHPQTQGAPPTDEDLEALTSDLDSAATFDFSNPQGGGEEGNANSTEQPEGNRGGLMDLNDLVPGPLLEQMEATNGDQSNFVADAEVPTEYPRDSFATPEQPSGFAVPYSTHATVENSETPEAAAQAEARRNTEEFMRNFQAQREVEEVAGEAGQVQNLEQPAVSEGDVGSQPVGQSQEILKEIFLQRQILDNVHYTGPSPATPEQSDSPSYQSEGPAPASDPSHEGLGADSVSVETPVTSYQNYQQAGEPPAGQDDRDMLYVNETQRYTPPQAEQPPQPPPFPNVETSTGNAQRMDYNQLFDQLRNSSPEQ